MADILRRSFVASGGAAAIAPDLLFGTSSGARVDDVLRSGIARRGIPAVVGLVASGSQTLYAGAFGQRDRSGVPAHVDSVFRIASMTKAVTTVAALQLVEQGKVDLEEPMAKRLPQLAELEVLEGFDGSGHASLRPAKTPITLRHLLTHTSGLCYDMWDGPMFRFTESKASYSKPGPLMFEPGSRWQYGQGVDWAGRLVETISGVSLEEYFQEKIFRPLGMTDTSYILPEAKFDRLVSVHQYAAGAEWKENERKMPSRPKSFNGGGGLYGTAGDYVRFMQMILNHGAGPNRTRILKASTVDSMMTNQIGPLTAGKMKSFKPEVSAAVDIQPGQTEKWGLGFLINTTAYPRGRSAGSLAWAGLYNTFYWIDPKRQRCAALLMQFLPFVDKQAIGLLDEFEAAVYRNL